MIIMIAVIGEKRGLAIIYYHLPSTIMIHHITIIQPSLNIHIYIYVIHIISIMMITTIKSSNIWIVMIFMDIITHIRYIKSPGELSIFDRGSQK